MTKKKQDLIISLGLLAAFMYSWYYSYNTISDSVSYIAGSIFGSFISVSAIVVMSDIYHLMKQRD